MNQALYAHMNNKRKMKKKNTTYNNVGLRASLQQLSWVMHIWEFNSFYFEISFF
jgi:hypothetical protein